MPSPILLTTPDAVVAGRAWIEPAAGGAARPLVVALHGGGFGGGYFTGPYPLPAAAARAGADTILLDRPGAPGSRFTARHGDVLSDNAAALDEAVARLWERHGEGRPGVFLIGHSIGGAIALMLAARRPAWPLIGVSVSGIAERPPAALPFDGGAAEATTPPLPRPALARIMLAPDAASDAALDALEAASVPAVTEELAAIYAVWPVVAGRTLRAIERPVQIVVAEHEPLWQVDAAALASLRRLVGEPPNEVVVWPRVGHSIDHHPAADAFHDAVFAFMKTSLV